MGTGTGTVAEVAYGLWGVEIRVPAGSRFAEEGWSYSEQVRHPCPVCGGALHSLRKPYVSSGKQYRYAVLICPACAGWFTLQRLGLRSYTDLSKPVSDRVVPRPPQAAPTGTDHPRGAPPSPPLDRAQEAPARTALEPDPQSERRADILRFWRSVEFFDAQKVKAAMAAERRYDVAPGHPAPWEDGHPLQRAEVKSGHVWRYTVYGGIYRLDRMHITLAGIFDENPIDVDERTPRGESALFAVEVTADGRLLLDTLTLSQAAWALSRAVEPGPEAPGWLAGFDDAAKEHWSAVEHAVKADEDDDKAAQLEEEGIAVSRPIRAELLHALVGDAIALLGVDGVLGPTGFRVQCRQVPRRAEHDSDSDFLNSFFVDDLGRVIRAVSSDDIGEALRSYLVEEPRIKRFDVRAEDNLDALVDMLAPEHAPAGRWPADPEHSLATSQQLAINQLAGVPVDQAGIFGINGPPGTGKTTMLRDLVAAVVTERARRLAAFDSPTHAFQAESTGWRTDSVNVRFHPLRTSLTGFEMLVASSNNGAVENVTREMPAAKAVAHPWTDADYLREHGTRVLGEDAWGLIAAVLGNRRNRGEFVSRLWFDVPGPPGEEPQPGLLRSLMAQHDQADPNTWPKAVTAFHTALAAEEAIRANRQAAHIALRDLPRREAAQHSAQDVAVQAARAADEAITAVVKMESAVAEASAASHLARERRRAHLDAKPGFLDFLATLGGAQRRWHKADEPLATRLRGAESAEDRAHERARQAQARGLETDRALNVAQSDLRRAESDLDQARAVVDGFRQSSAALVPDSAWRESGDARELRAPWLDAEWNIARTNVFLAALELHQAFMVAAGHKIQRLLGAAIDVVKGSVPDDAPVEAVRAAWQALFLLVPVVSTTFASVGRMLAPLGRESVGWLLVDEAGQAAPQAAAGAIWRARRVVAVGDPLQLEPVVTILHTTQARLRDYHGVTNTWLPGWQSVQTLTDRVTPVGTTLAGPDGEDLWVGAPLRVHRRCAEPMFSIVNDAVYNRLMIDGQPGRKDPYRLLDENEENRPTLLDRPVDQSRWIDVRSEESSGNWIPAEGEAAIRVLRDLIQRHGIPPTDILVLSPFRDVADKLKELIKELDPTDGVIYGTVHKSQGKQAPFVLFVLGGTTAGVRTWAAERPNLLNVAVSRAEHRLYVIGNREEWRRQSYFSTLAARLPVLFGEVVRG